MKIEDIIKKLKLDPLKIEGGYFRNTYKSDLMIPQDFLPEKYSSCRSISSCIYYLITPDQCSKLHRLPGIEIFHFYLGDPVQMLNLYPDGTGETIILGNDILNGHKLQHIVKENTWQGCRLIDEGKFALLGTTMSPAFDYNDFEKGNQKDLVDNYPDFVNIIKVLSSNI